MSDNSSKKLSELKECPCCKSNAGVFYLTPNGEKIQIGFDEIGEEVKRVQEAERLYGGKRTKAHCLACGEDLGTFNTDIISVSSITTLRVRPFIIIKKQKMTR